MDETELYRQAIALWGRDAQLLMVFEEIGELMQAISKRERGKNNIEQIIEEITDVRIMLDQLEVIYGLNAMSIVVNKARKLKRLEERVVFALQSQRAAIQMAIHHPKPVLIPKPDHTPEIRFRDETGNPKSFGWKKRLEERQNDNHNPE